MERFKYLNLEYKTGIILGKCTLEDCLLVDDKLKEELTEKDPVVYYGAKKKKKK